MTPFEPGMANQANMASFKMDGKALMAGVINFALLAWFAIPSS